MFKRWMVKIIFKIQNLRYEHIKLCQKVSLADTDIHLVIRADASIKVGFTCFLLPIPIFCFTELVVVVIR